MVASILAIEIETMPVITNAAMGALLSSPPGMKLATNTKIRPIYISDN